MSVDRWLRRTEGAEKALVLVHLAAGNAMNQPGVLHGDCRIQLQYVFADVVDGQN
jgi:hypothetical protein